MDGKDIHVLKKSANPDSSLRVQVPEEEDYVRVFHHRMHLLCGEGQTTMAGDVDSLYRVKLMLLMKLVRIAQIVKQGRMA